MSSPRRLPVLNLWFGNFYEPQYSDRFFVDRAVAQIAGLGFTTVMLDSKSWQDFHERYAGGPASPYVATQEYLMTRLREAGLTHNFLALYLNGDNLYPHIRFSPPVLGESVTAADGTDGQWYKYWSPRAQDSMVRHVDGLLRLYSDNLCRFTAADGEKLPICSMWDPIVAPSFDAEGIDRYRGWLEGTYGSIRALNEAYGTVFASFSALGPADYWAPLKFGETLFSAADVEALSPRFRIAADNRRWQRAEFSEFFRSMERRLHALEPRLRLTPNLTQWNFFLNINGSDLPGVGFADLWDTANRGIDPFAVRDFVDDVTFTLVPVTPAGDPEAWVVSCQASLIRSLNRGREFSVGLFFGRFLCNDVLRYVPPVELVGSAVAAGATDLFVYGWGGMDDGGILHRMEPAFLESVRAGNAWARTVVPLTGAHRPSPVALLFPSAMALCEPLGVAGAPERRLDLLGWYRSTGDAGYQADILDLSQVEEGLLDGYRILVLPADSCYQLVPNPRAEARLRAWVEAGGILVHGPGDQKAEAVFDIVGSLHDHECIDHEGEGILVQGTVFCSWDRGTVLATWRTSGLPSLVSQSFGRGRVLSFGFRYGSSYASRIAPHVPRSQGNQALYPVNYLERDPWHRLLASELSPPELTPARDVEIADFEHGWVVVNHASSVYRLPDGTALAGHAAAFVGRDRTVVS